MSHSDLFKAIINARHLFAITNRDEKQGAINCYLAITSWINKHYGHDGVVIFRSRFAEGGALDPNFIAFYHSLFYRSSK